ncbi:MAG TPA: GNAT family N-acetyltransferase [Actinocrinis sp.]|nr:GNAT family N-acetyltransferase [Actinocrinis sp.]
MYGSDLVGRGAFALHLFARSGGEGQSLPQERHQHQQHSHSDDALLDGIAELLVAAVARREALGLVGPLTVDDYYKHLADLLADAERGDAGLIAAVGPDGAVLGSAQWTRSPYATRRVLGELDRVSVAPEARGLGVGRAMVDRIAVDASAHGIELLMLEARGNNHGAIALYERCDFVRTGSLPNAVAEGPARHDVIFMCHELGRAEDAQLHGSDAVGAGASTLRQH